MRFNDSLLESFMDDFYGYGNLDGRLWFVGMEESGGDFEEISGRLSTWDCRGRRPVEDAAEYHPGFGRSVNFCDRRPVIRRSWCECYTWHTRTLPVVCAQLLGAGVSVGVNLCA
jgi:hypothetical protein